MRYYKLSIVQTQSESSTTSSSGATTTASKSLTFTTHPNGLSSAADMGALHVLFDLPTTPFHDPSGAAYIEVRGVDISTINQASNLQGATVKLYGGMGAGLPLNDTTQAGLLVQGVVIQAFGNWMDTEMSLNLLVTPFANDNPKLVWHWATGQTLEDAITKALSPSYSSYKLKFNLSQNTVATHDYLGFYSDLSSFAQILLSDSSNALAGDASTGYIGVRFYVSGTSIVFYDSSTADNPKQLQFKDLMGQPTWLGPSDYPKIMFQTVMRADIALGDVVTMPKFNQNGSTQTASSYGTIAPTSTSITSPKGRSLFQGNFSITSVRHIGDSRSPDGRSWVTAFEAVKI